MFNWFVLQPGSIAALAEFALSFVLLLYIVNIKNKPLDTKLFLLFATTSTFYYLVAFLYFSEVDFQEQGPMYWAHQIVLALFQLSIVPFAYNFKNRPFVKEEKIVYPLFVVVTAITLYFNSFDVPVNWAFYALMIGWVVLVYIRKAVLAARLANKDNTTAGDESQKKRITLREIIAVFRYPPNRDCIAFLAFAKWNTIVVVIWLNVNLMGLGIIPRFIWNPLHNTLLLLVQMYLVVNFINYANVVTTFLVKLIALSLSAVLLLLGVMGFLLYHSDNIYNITGQPERTLRTLAILVVISTIVIVVAFPIYFKRNLLEPLDQVLAGVKKVADGDLNVNVAVEANDEIGYLAKQFNTMTGSLREYSNEMETLVAQRTEELEQSLTNLKATQAQLIQQEKMASLGELTAGIAHEIQNPLNFVNNFSEVNLELAAEIQTELRKGNVGEAISVTGNLEDNLQKVIFHGKRTEAIVKSMLQHSRVSTGQKEPTDINALCEECLRLSYHGLCAQDKNFRAGFQTRFDDTIGKITVVPQDIGRALLNLFNNAFYAVNERAKFSANGYQPFVSVSTKSVGDKIEIAITDNGKGIPPNIVDKIFQPFFTTKPTGQGTGLGLSLAYDIVKAHNGEIKVETKSAETTGQTGTKFLLLLPLENMVS